jgi:hypothetical protein
MPVCYSGLPGDGPRCWGRHATGRVRVLTIIHVFPPCRPKRGTAFGQRPLASRRVNFAYLARPATRFRIAISPGSAMSAVRRTGPRPRPSALADTAPSHTNSCSSALGSARGGVGPGGRAIFRDASCAAALARVESPSPRAVGVGLLAVRRRAAHHPGRPVNPACSGAARQAHAASPMQSRDRATA